MSAARPGRLRTSPCDRPACHVRRLRSDRGAADALGIAIVAPAAIGLALVVAFLGRQVDTRATAQNAAEAAAQAAAQERSPSEAVAAAQSVAASMLVDPLTCADPRVDVDVSAFLDPATPMVAVSVTCTTSTDGLEAIGAPAPTGRTVTAYATLDPFRETTP